MKKLIKWGLIAFGVIIVIAIIASAGGGGGEKATSPEKKEVQEAPATPAPVEQEKTEPAQEAPPPPKPEEWVTVLEVSGNANKTTDTFELLGGKTKLTYDVKGNPAMFGAYVLEEGWDFDKQGGIPEVMISESGTDATFLTKSAGKYYVKVISANANWTVKIEELR